MFVDSLIGNYFNVFVDGAFRCILKASIKATCCEGPGVLST